MCGISGIINFNNAPVEEHSLKMMMKIMKHRGPDDEDVFLYKNIGFGFVRLSIIDLSIDGRQPMQTANGRLTIIFNGEIYNYIELRKKLEKEFIFQTKTDTEVILFAYLKWGKECLDKFNGMFAFAIYDKLNDEVFIARDRFGIKPLYYFWDTEKFIFSSEIKPILNATKDFYKPEQNDQIVYDFLVYNRTNHTSNTFFDKIFKLQHGHNISIKNGKVKYFKWYNLEERIKTYVLDKSTDFSTLFRSAIELRLRSDVTVGACLSGGLDSSSIVATIINDFKKNDLNTFSAIYEQGERGDESIFINLFKEKINNMHFTKPTHVDLLDNINNYITALEEPIPGTSAFAEFMVYKLAQKYCTVILNGQGADETMGGYLYFAGFLYKELFLKLNWIKLIKEINADIKNHKTYEGPMAFIYFMLPAPLKDSFSKNNAAFLNPQFAKKYKGDISFLKNLYGSNTLKKALINHFEYKFEHHLIWGDKSSMWFSLESRYPFLDYRLVEYMLAQPNNQIINNGSTKVLIRKAMKNIVPKEIINRHDKVGYETPEDKWFREKEMISFIKNIINSESFKSNKYIDYRKANKLYDKHIDKQINIAKEIWKWVHLELWLRKYIYKLI